MSGHCLDGGWHMADAILPKPYTEVLVVVHNLVDDSETVSLAWRDTDNRWFSAGHAVPGKISYWMRPPNPPTLNVGRPQPIPMEFCYGRI